MRLRSARARRRRLAARADRNPQEHPEVASARQACGHRVQRALHRGRRDRLPPGLRARLRGYRFEAPGLTLSLRARRLLGEGQEPGSARGYPRGRGGVELRIAPLKSAPTFKHLAQMAEQWTVLSSSDVWPRQRIRSPMGRTKSRSNAGSSPNLKPMEARLP